MCTFYPGELKDFPQQIKRLLEDHHAVMHAELRRRLVTALVLMRNRGLLPPLDVIPLLFRMFRIPDKMLRSMAFTAIIGDIKKVNAKHKNNSVNAGLQNYMCVQCVASANNFSQSPKVQYAEGLGRCRG